MKGGQGCIGASSAAFRLEERFPGRCERYDLCSRKTKNEIMKNIDERQPDQPAACQLEDARENTVTQLTPDDIMTDGGPIAETRDGSPSERQLEQDVVMVNPSADSMDSRG